MKRKDGFAKKASTFLAGSGFYLVLLLCIGVIGISAWAMLSRDIASGGLDLPVIAEVEDWAQLPPSVPTIGGTQQTPQETQQPEGNETFLFGRDDEEAAEPEESEPPAEETVEEEPAPPPPEPAPRQFVWPVSGDVEVPHSLDSLIFDRTMGDWRTHAGIDIRADLGETVLAITGGVVERIFHDDLLGMTVVISHGDGLRSLYANLMEHPLVEEGQWVSMGTPIGAVGTTALAKSGIVHHLHLEMFDSGEQVDPMRFLPERNL